MLEDAKQRFFSFRTLGDHHQNLRIETEVQWEQIVIFVVMLFEELAYMES